MRSLEPQRDHRAPVVWILASGSPRRFELLRAAGQRCFEVVPSRADESRGAGEEAFRYVTRVARDKAREVAARRPGVPVLAADTIVLVDGEPLGKPCDPADAAFMLDRLSNRAHEVVTAFVLLDASGTTIADRVVRTEVVFRPLGAEEIADYVASGEPLDKAGAYAIQGRGAAFVSRIEGSYSGIMGLPLAETADLLQRFNIPVL